jgi:hypothetical protein
LSLPHVTASLSITGSNIEAWLISEATTAYPSFNEAATEGESTRLYISDEVTLPTASVRSNGFRVKLIKVLKGKIQSLI